MGKQSVRIQNMGRETIDGCLLCAALLLCSFVFLVLFFSLSLARSLSALCVLSLSCSNGQLGFLSTPHWYSPSPSPKMCMSLYRKGVSHISASRHHSAVVTEEGDAFATFIIDSQKMSEKNARFHKLKPKLPIVDIVATPLDTTLALDAQGCVYRWDHNSFDEVFERDDTLETRKLIQISAGLEHVCIVGTMNKKWRMEAMQQAAAANNAVDK